MRLLLQQQGWRDVLVARMVSIAPRGAKVKQDIVVPQPHQTKMLAICVLPLLIVSVDLMVLSAASVITGTRTHTSAVKKHLFLQDGLQISVLLRMKVTDAEQQRMLNAQVAWVVLAKRHLTKTKIIIDVARELVYSMALITALIWKMEAVAGVMHNAKVVCVKEIGVVRKEVFAQKRRTGGNHVISIVTVRIMHVQEPMQ
mmetsp:Transcript_16222/g.20220  ORF Transcript_16222/g.20220 Transcript_16222/m.20220 type:complete len:200 (-) Transcript_16222:697-1296(-)